MTRINPLELAAEIRAAADTMIVGVLADDHHAVMEQLQGLVGRFIIYWRQAKVTFPSDDKTSSKETP